jgi:hypothetical protein
LVTGPRVRSCSLAAAFLLLVSTSSVLAQAPGAVPPLEPASSGVSGGVEGLVTFGKFSEDYFLSVGVGTTLAFSDFMVGIQAPLKIRVIDNEPDGQPWYREEDWDEPSDWTRILRFFQYGQPQDLFYLRLGELVSASIGHGTIVGRYYNTLELDHYHTGLSTKLNLEQGGAEVLTNDILKWNLVAVRGYVHPFLLAMEDPHPVLRKLAVGTTFAADFLAPTRVSTETSADEKQPTDVAWFTGIDLELEAVRTSTYALTPYTDLNFFATRGTGWHLGVLNELSVLKSTFELRLEYRLLSSRYAPSYFNTMYDIERVAFLPLPQFDGAADNPAVPKQFYFEKADGLKLRNGFYGELFANVLGLVGIGGIYEDYQGADNASVTLRADLPEIAGAKLAAYYTRRNFDGFSELFSLDDAMLVAEARYRFFGPMFAYGIYSVSWQETTDAEGFKTYESEDSFQAGLGASFSF